MKRILFLDVDGVLNSTPFLRGLGKEHSPILQPAGHDPAQMIDPVLVARLNAILDGLDVRVVLSSSWRHAYTIEQVRDYLGRRGFVGKLVDYTPPIGGDRSVAIKRWLAAQYPEVDRFVVLDDFSDAGRTIERHFVQTKTAVGLEDEHVTRARRILE